MKKQYHVLNGDSLREQFPEKIKGEVIVARECLVDGPVKNNNLEQLYSSRATFIAQNYEGFTIKDYYDRTVPELNKISSIPENSEINLWFEDDLFCQVNFWFTINLLKQNNSLIFLIRPQEHTRLGFGGLNKSELQSIFEERLLLTETHKLASLWNYYQADNLDNLLQTAKDLNNLYPFILNAVEAHIDRIPSVDSPGRPKASLIQIIEELKTEQFGLVFQEFSKRESIYGYGDLQVKKLFDEIINKRKY